MKKLIFLTCALICQTAHSSESTSDFIKKMLSGDTNGTIEVVITHTFSRGNEQRYVQMEVGTDYQAIVVTNDPQSIIPIDLPQLTQLERNILDGYTAGKITVRNQQRFVQEY